MKIICYFPNFDPLTCNSLINSSFDSLCFVVTGMPYSVNNAPQDLSTGSLIKTLLSLTDMLSLNKQSLNNVYVHKQNFYRLIVRDVGCNNKMV